MALGESSSMAGVKGTVREIFVISTVFYFSLGAEIYSYERLDIIYA